MKTKVIFEEDKQFTYDKVFSKSSSQLEVYEASVKPLLSALFKVYNGTVLAYGQTGSGKTYTMGTDNNALRSVLTCLNSDTNQNLDDIGIIPRFLIDLFDTIQIKQCENSESKFKVNVSFAEIYLEKIRDLLSNTTSNESLNIQMEKNEIQVVGLSEIVVTNALDTIKLVEKGSSFRAIGGTGMNEKSSRSHAIITIVLEQNKFVFQFISLDLSAFISIFF